MKRKKYDLRTDYGLGEYIKDEFIDKACEKYGTFVVMHLLWAEVMGINMFFNLRKKSRYELELECFFTQTAQFIKKSKSSILKTPDFTITMGKILRLYYEYHFPYKTLWHKDPNIIEISKPPFDVFISAHIKDLFKGCDKVVFGKERRDKKMSKEDIDNLLAYFCSTYKEWDDVKGGLAKVCPKDFKGRS